jgi:sigma-B regulation protein RsbU (phosphoserine phosphatase)
MPPCLPVESRKPKRPRCDLQRLHQGALPSVQRLHPGFAVDAWSRPVGRIGGDVIAAWQVDDRRLVAFLGDVMGHGTPAAVVASGVRSTLHHLRAAGLFRPTELLARINRTVLDLFPEYFLTACCCLFDTAGTLTCAVAGHPSPLVRSPDGGVDSVVSRSLPLGVTARPEIGEFALAFDAGSSVVVYSDGVSDTLADGPRLGGDAIAGVLRGVRSGAPEAITRGIRRAVRRVDRPREDDCSVLVVQRAE